MSKLNASSRIMFEEAQKMGIKCVPFEDKETILMEIDEKTWYTRGSRTTLQSSVGKTIADNKDLTKQILHHFKLPTARHCKVTQAEDLQQLESLQFPLVMKPLSQRHGKGVEIGIKSTVEAEQKFTAQNSFTVIFEEMLEGTEYRIVCVDYRFLAAAFRKPAYVIGDGEHSISQLIDEKNKHPWRGRGHEANLTLIEIDQIVLNNLAEQGLTPDSVPQAEKEIILRKTANLSTGGEAWDVTEQVSPENRVLFETIAHACNLNIIGIDIMCHSLTEPIINQAKAGVIEVNASPGLRMHHFPMKGKPRNIAHEIIQMTMTQIAEPRTS